MIILYIYIYSRAPGLTVKLPSPGISKYVSPGTQLKSPGAQGLCEWGSIIAMDNLSHGGTTILAFTAIVKTKTNQ